MKRKIILLMVAFLMLFTSCAHKQTAVLTEEAPPIVTTEEEINPFTEKIASLPAKDFGGKKFRIATDNPSLLVSGDINSVVGKEIYLRNKAIEEKFNIKLTLTDESGLPTITERIKTEALAGTDYCDLVVLESTQFQTLAASQSLVNVRSVPYLDTGGRGMHPESLASTTQFNFSYGISGDFSYQPEKLYAVFYNKMLLGNTNLPNIYQLVNDNQWDFENFLLYSEEVYSLGKVNDQRVFGFISTADTETLINAFWAASGDPFLVNQYGSWPSLDYNYDTTYDFIDKVKNLLFSTSSYVADHENAIKRFSNNEFLFLIAPLSAAEELSEKAVKWGVVPLPKRDINQNSFYSYLGTDHCLAGFTKGSPDLEMSGMVTTALYAATNVFKEDTFINTYLNLYLSAPDDALMLSRIFRSPYYDPAQFFGLMESSYSAATQTLLYRSISSEGDFEALYEQYQIMFNKYLQNNL